MGNNKSGLIPKPEGEAGRPGRGGYNLEQTLGWPKKEYEHIKKFMKKLVEEHLEPSKNFSSQSLSSLANVRALASDRFPALRNYADHWPVMDFIRLELKYTCGRARLQEDKKLVKVGKAKVGKHKTKTSE
ncbi:hypothetical protein CPB84DRAFT_1770996 [Gymnopilus junonius]|uniref:Uncharacterized protein n=1 Tax=Gymnopilus junonius TaxID=109634 RepID=A0A9P5NVQ5_GYMJU|nr:hypothetical protein CPB84DRAFT_1791057 [Gymnopilus junonius]KAF8906071.1 hypothetical protein CPB84DRAFT_1770996 [Gymnopilus junonius]